MTIVMWLAAALLTLAVAGTVAVSGEHRRWTVGFWVVALAELEAMLLAFRAVFAMGGDSLLTLVVAYSVALVMFVLWLRPERDRHIRYVRWLLKLRVKVSEAIWHATGRLAALISPTVATQVDSTCPVCSLPGYKCEKGHLYCRDGQHDGAGPIICPACLDAGAKTIKKEVTTHHVVVDSDNIDSLKDILPPEIMSEVMSMVRRAHDDEEDKTLH